MEFVFPAASVGWFVEAVRLEELVRIALWTGMLIVGLYSLIFALEWLTGADRSMYRSRVFKQDLLYSIFYLGGFYDMLIWSGLANAFGDRVAFIRIDALAGLPGPLHWILFYAATDFCYYWFHRWQHAWGPLWAIHSVHHSQEEMTSATTYRFHPLDQIMNSILAAALLWVLGVPTFSWLPLWVGIQIFNTIQHSSLTWGYGRAYRVLVSPRFHSFHHSAEPQHYNGNFSKTFSFWDFLFGTGVEEQQRPVRLGVDGMPVPRTLLAQVIAPIQIIARSRRPDPVTPVTKTTTGSTPTT